MHSRLPLIAALLTLAATVSAQGVIQSGNVRYSVATLPNSVSSSNGVMDFTASGIDQCFQCTWYYRLGNDTREYAFNSGSGQLRQTFAGDTAELRWNNVDGRNIAAVKSIRVYSTGPMAGVASQRMSITNNTGASLRLNLFCYLDADGCGTPELDMAVSAGPGRIRISDFLQCQQDYLEFFALQSDRYEVSTYASLRARLLDNQVDDLTDTGLPLGPADVTAAFQWKDRILLPGQTLTVATALAHNTTVCAGMAEAETFGTAQAGTSGPATFGIERPYLGAVVPLVVRDGIAGATPVLLLGTTRTNQQVPGVGTLYTDVLASFLLPPFDPSRQVMLPLSLPQNSALCGLRLHWQALWLDPTAPSSFAHTGGLTWTLGSL